MQVESEQFQKTDRTALRRMPSRGAYDRRTVNAILDEGFLCHLAFVIDGRPAVVPTAYGRVGDRLYVHGSAAARAMRAARDDGGLDVCLEVTLLDGLVLARSAFNHSMNYRCVVVYGKAMPVTDPRERLESLRAFAEHLVPGRWSDVREPTERELRATSVLALPLEEASAKVRTGPPSDEEEDYELPVWAGVIPLEMVARPPVTDVEGRRVAAAPAYALEYRRPGGDEQDPGRMRVVA